MPFTKKALPKNEILRCKSNKYVQDPCKENYQTLMKNQKKN